MIDMAAASSVFKGLSMAKQGLDWAIGKPVRSDAAHYLALTESAEAIPILLSLLNDESAEVREIATDGLKALRP